MFETSAIAETQDISLVLRAGGSSQSRFLQLHRDASSHVFSPTWGSAWHLGFIGTSRRGELAEQVSAASPRRIISCVLSDVGERMAFGIRSLPNAGECSNVHFSSLSVSYPLTYPLTRVCMKDPDCTKPSTQTQQVQG